MADTALVLLVLLLAWPAYNLAQAGFVRWRPRPAVRPGRPAPTPVFWLVLPALNQEAGIAGTVTAALALDPAVRVLVVDDGSTDRTARIVAGIDDPRLFLLRRVTPNARHGKGEALNAAYRYVWDAAVADGSVDRCVLGVFDAAGRGTPGMLAKIGAYLGDPDVAAVQCAVRVRDRRRFAAVQQDLATGGVADAGQRLRDRLGSAELGGAGQFVRLTALSAFGDRPWSRGPAEDLDLSLRLHLAGRRVRYAADAVVTRQGPADGRATARSRTRAAQGDLQCLRYVPRLLTDPSVRPPARLGFGCRLLAPWVRTPLALAVLGMVVLTATGMALGVGFGGLVGTGAPSPRTLACWLAVLFGPGLLWAVTYLLRYADAAPGRALLAGLAYPGFVGLGLVASWRALGRHLAGRTGRVRTGPLSEPAGGQDLVRRAA